MKHPHTFVWFPERIRLIIPFVGQMFTLNNRNWLETDDFFITTAKNTEKMNRGILSTVFLYANSLLGTTPPILSRLEIFSAKNTFAKKPTQTNTTQYPDLFVTYIEGFSMNNGTKTLLLLMKNLR